MWLKLLFEGEEIGEALLENGENLVQDPLVVHGQVALGAVLVGLDLQDDDLGGLLLGGQQDQVSSSSWWVPPVLASPPS